MRKKAVCISLINMKRNLMQQSCAPAALIRNAETADLPSILGIYAYAREFMVQTGNPTQWGDDYPSEPLLGNDIAGRMKPIPG